MPRWWWLSTAWPFVLMNIGRSIDQFLTKWLPFLSEISEVNREFLYWILPVTAAAVWAFVKWVIPVVKRLYNWWWIRRDLRKPREHELGYHDHRELLKKLWVRLSYLRSDVYKLLATLGKLTADVKNKRETAPARFWSALAARMEPKTAKLERVAAEMSQLTPRMLSSFSVVCGRSTQASLEALKLFTENDPTTLQWQMKEDALHFLGVKIFFGAMKGEKFEMNRACDRINAAVDEILKSNIEIFGACEKVIDGAQLPTPRLDPVRVRATKAGSYANGRRPAGAVFYIRSEDEFSSDWMEKI
jgi:hypothetical protein